MRPQEIYDLIDEEIGWHNSDKTGFVTAEYREGFISGMRQVKHLVAAYVRDTQPLAADEE